MTQPTQVLRDEHQVILQALGLLEEAAGRLARGATLPDGWWAQMVDFLRAFADRNHHAKEEQALFPALARAGVPTEGGPVGVMLEEHVRGRGLLQAMGAAGPAVRANAARDYAALLRAHIHKEDGVLWPLAEAVLDAEAMAGVARAFEAVEAQQGRDASAPDAAMVVKGLRDALG